MLLCPTSTQYLVGTPWRFFWGSENPSVLGVHGFSGSRKNSKGRKIMTFYCPIMPEFPL